MSGLRVQNHGIGHTGRGFDEFPFFRPFYMQLFCTVVRIGIHRKQLFCTIVRIGIN